MAQRVKSIPTVESLHSGYPLQQHAGKVGYGPNYNVGASVFDKVGGHAQEVIGRVTRNPKLINKGHERHTGENKRRKALGEDSTMDPFTAAGNDTTMTTNKNHPSNKTYAAELKSQKPNANSVRQSSKEASPK